MWPKDLAYCTSLWELLYSQRRSVHSQGEVLMKHVKSISKSPAKAQLTPGQIVTILADLFAVLSNALLLKEGGGSTN